jgi:hypothetical protein
MEATGSSGLCLNVFLLGKFGFVPSRTRRNYLIALTMRKPVFPVRETSL